MALKWTKFPLTRKQSFLGLAIALVLGIVACSVNPATGNRQFTALLSPEREAQVGAQEHPKIEAQFGSFMKGPIATYVSNIGQKLAVNTERKEVKYQFFVIDTPMVNAFALPGGYIYVTRGLLTLANSEAEMAAVVAHEIAHVTGRHSAERMSQGTLIGLGAAAVGIATGSSAAGQAANLGSNLYLSSYSRKQENEADNLGIRYLARAGYDPKAMTRFLNNLDKQSKFEAKQTGKKIQHSFFSTHPMTSDRVAITTKVAAEYPQSEKINRATYLQKINGLDYGDSAAAGFARGNTFYHPVLGFAFDVPKGSRIINQPSKVVAQHSNGNTLIFDAANDKSGLDVYQLLTQKVLANEKTTNAERIKINGMDAATASFPGTINGRSVTLRVTLIEWAKGEFFRFQMAIPRGTSAAFISELKKSTYSFRRLSASEKRTIQPKKLRVVTASSRDTVDTLAAKMDVEKDKREHFLVLNGMTNSSRVQSGQPYKIVTK
ncbi:MAG: M48 family metalloprotease [Pseudomonadota bacterium]